MLFSSINRVWFSISSAIIEYKFVAAMQNCINMTPFFIIIIKTYSAGTNRFVNVSVYGSHPSNWTSVFSRLQGKRKKVKDIQREWERSVRVHSYRLLIKRTISRNNVLCPVLSRGSSYLPRFWSLILLCFTLT